MFVARRVASYRRATGVRRQQFKWVMCGSAITATAIPMFAFVSVTWIQPFAGAAVAALPIAIGVAILRYRLYEIDVIIRKTLDLRHPRGLLAVVYLGGIYLIGRALQAITGQSGALAVTALHASRSSSPSNRCEPGSNELSITASTARSTTPPTPSKTFASRLRDQIELDALTADVIDVVNATLQPRHASLWLRPDTTRPKTTPTAGPQRR